MQFEQFVFLGIDHRIPNHALKVRVALFDPFLAGGKLEIPKPNPQWQNVFRTVPRVPEKVRSEMPPACRQRPVNEYRRYVIGIKILIDDGFLLERHFALIFVQAAS
jgi:hypothetical protein